MSFNKIIISFLFVFAILKTVNAAEEAPDVQIKRALSALNKDPDNMYTLRNLCTIYLNKADFNNALKYGERLQKIAYDKGDYDNYVIYSHVIMGEAYTMKGDAAHAFSNLGQAERNATSAKNDSAMSAVCNAMAIYYVNMHNDTYRALTYLFRGLDTARRSRNSRLYNIILSNIAETYYLRQDTTGLKYALECHDIGRRENNAVLLFHSGISAAYLYTLKGDLDRATQFIDESAALMQKNTFHDRAQVFNIRGIIAMKRGLYSEAASLYKRSIAEQTDGSVPNTVFAYLGYARSVSALGRQNEAVDSLKRGLAIARRGNSYRYMPDLLREISACYEKNGKIGTALSYYKLFHLCNDTLYNAEKERAVGDMRAKYDTAVKDGYIKQQQIDLMRTHNRTLILIGLLVVAVVTTTLLYIMYRRKNILYKTIVQQNIAAIKREKELKQKLDGLQNKKKYASSSLSAGQTQNIFARIETLMEEQKPYRNRLLTKEQVADMLETNRTYLSHAINEHTGQTFTAYIGALRIKEAVNILSDPSNNTPLKAVCQDVGFSSMTTFYNLFQQTTGMTPAAYRAKVVEMNLNH